MTECTDEERWAASIAECETLDDWNKYVVSRMKTHGPVFLQMAVTEARKREYVIEKVNGEKTGRYILGVKMELTKGHNVIRVGWMQGVLYAEFATSDKRYAFPGAPLEDKFKLLRSPFPDSLFNKLKAKWPTA